MREGTRLELALGAAALLGCGIDLVAPDWAPQLEAIRVLLDCFHGQPLGGAAQAGLV